MKQPNLKGLGLKQLGLIYRMIKEDLVIRVIADHDKRPTIELQDEGGDNTYETVPVGVMRSLGARRVFSCSGWMPALFITIDTYRIKKRVSEVLMNSEPEAQECDATKLPKEQNDGKQTPE